MTACILCGAVKRDRFGVLEHEPCCPHFMRGPDAGGDPAEWPTLLEAINELECPDCGNTRGVPDSARFACPACWDALGV